MAIEQLVPLDNQQWLHYGNAAVCLCYDQNGDLHMSTAWPFKLRSGECVTFLQHLVGGWDTVPSFPRVLVRMWVGAWVNVLACMGVCLSAFKHSSDQCKFLSLE